MAEAESAAGAAAVVAAAGRRIGATVLSTSWSGVPGKAESTSMGDMWDDGTAAAEALAADARADDDEGNDDVGAPGPAAARARERASFMSSWTGS